MSYVEDISKKRGRILRAYKDKSKTVYKDITNA